jgi:hypothetical protein
VPIIASPILVETSTAGFLNVGPGSNPPGTLPDATKGTVAGVWGFVGPLVAAPQQASSPPVTCAVFGQTGLLNLNPPPLASFAGVVGFAESGVGVYGAGSNYGVYGQSTGNVAGICGTNSANSTAPGIYAQTLSLAPGILAIGGTAALIDEVLSTNLDEAAAQWGSQYPDNAGLFIGGVAVTGGLVIGPNPSATPAPAGSLTASGAITGTTCTFQGGSETAVFGVNGAGSGTTPDAGCGVWGDSKNGYGVYGASIGSKPAVYGFNNAPSGGGTAISGTSAGLYGESTHFEGVHGLGHGGGAGVSGINDGPAGSGSNAMGVYGQSSNGHGVSALSLGGGVGVWGESQQSDGVHGLSHSSGSAGVFGTNDAGGLAGSFEGNVSVSGNLAASDVILSGGDCAEQFDAAGAEALDPGTVLVIDDDGTLRQSEKAYDRRVAGVVSGAGTFKPGIVLDRCGDGEGRTTIALIGKVYCKVDADSGSIAVGDLLTSSATPGHAMKVADPLKGVGSVIGKALKPLATGRGLLPILVALQ